MIPLKQTIRRVVLRLIAFISKDINDCFTGETLGRGFLLAWGRSFWLIGYSGRPLIPRFLPQRRLTIWRQVMGFTTHPPPDFPSLSRVGSSAVPNPVPWVMNIVLTHQGGAHFRRLMQKWGGVSQMESVWIAFGGSKEEFDLLDFPRKVFIDDPDLRKVDNQRDKQSYTGIFRGMAGAVKSNAPDFIHLCEYDHVVLIPDLNARQMAEMKREQADVMGHMLVRMDGSGHYFQLYHESEPGFAEHWKNLSVREDKRAVLNMFGSGSVWTREAFLDVARRPQEIPCYLETYLPTLAHHLGYRVRCWDESRHLLSNLPSPSINEGIAVAKGCWTVHPVKQ
jgi:hypothetical protein